MPYRIWNRFGSMITLLVFLPGVSLLAPVGLLAQSSYRVLRGDADLTDLRSAKTRHNNAKKALNGDVELDKAKELLDAYYDKFVIPTFTNVERGSMYGDLRLEFQRDMRDARSPKARMHVLAKMFRACQGIAKSDQFHPSARYNAILVLADLNRQEEDSRGGKVIPPLPLEQGLKVLLDLYRDPKSPDVVRVGALVGLRRHVLLRTMPQSPKPFEAAEREALGKMLLPLVETKQPPEGCSPDAHDWMRSRAAELIGRLGLPGEGEAIAKALLATIGDETESLRLRTMAAGALGYIDLGKSTMSPEALAAAYGSLVTAVAKYEVDELKKLFANSGTGEFRQIPRMNEGGLNYGDERDSKKVEFVDPQTIPTRRRFLARMERIREGLVGDGRNWKGVQGTLANASSTLPALLAAIDKMVEIAKDPDSSVADLGRTLLEDYRALQKQLASLAPPPPEPVATAEELKAARAPANP